jgi:hypothetical protein
MRRAFLFVAAALAGAGLAVAGLGLASPSALPARLSASLTAGAERPRPKAPVAASGRFTATLTGSRLTWRLTFLRLSGKAIAAHVHLGRVGVAGPVVVPLCAPCRSGAHGAATVSAKIRLALITRSAYVNVHTPTNPAGEIRGQILGGTLPPIATTQAQPTTTSGGGDDGGGGYGGY